MQKISKYADNDAMQIHPVSYIKMIKHDVINYIGVSKDYSWWC